MGGTTHLAVSELTAARSGLDEADAYGVARQVDPIAQAELLEQVRAVPVDGLLADVQHRRDLLAAVALRDQLQHLALALGQRARARRVSRGRALYPLAHRIGYPLREHEAGALRGGAARAHELLVDRGLEHVGLRARLCGLAEVLLVRVHRQQHAPHVWVLASDLRSRLQAGHAR